MKFKEIARENIKDGMLKKLNKFLIRFKTCGQNGGSSQSNKIMNDKLDLINKSIENIDVFSNRVIRSIENSDLYKIINEEDLNDLDVNCDGESFSLINNKGETICFLSPNLKMSEILYSDSDDDIELSCKLFKVDFCENTERPTIVPYANKITKNLEIIKSDVDSLLKKLFSDFSFLKTDFNCIFFTYLNDIKNINEGKVKEGFCCDFKIKLCAGTVEIDVDYAINEHERIKKDFENELEFLISKVTKKSLSFHEIQDLVSNLRNKLLGYEISKSEIDYNSYFFGLSYEKIDSCSPSLKIEEKEFYLYLFPSLFDVAQDLSELQIYYFDGHKSKFIPTGMLLNDYLINKEAVVSQIHMMFY